MTYKTLLVNLVAGRTNADVLTAATTLAGEFSADVIGITACAPIQILYADGYACGDFFEQDSKDMATEIAAAEAEFRAAFGAVQHSLEWRSAVVLTPLAEYLAGEARRADLILTGTVLQGSFRAERQIRTGDLVMHSGRPVLVVAPAPAVLGWDRMMIAWKETRESRRAVVDALPLLRKARSVGLVEIALEADINDAEARLDDVAAWLASHDVTATPLAVRSDGEDVAALERLAVRHGANVIVAGAYGHSRAREWALGGMTRSLLLSPTRSSIVSH